MEEKTSCLFFVVAVELELKTSANVNVQMMSRKAGAVICEKRKRNDNLVWLHIKIVVQVD